MLPLLFILTTVTAMVLFFVATGYNRWVALFFSGWAAIIASLAWKGFFQNTWALPPRMLVVLVPAILAVVYFYRTIPVERVCVRGLLWVHVLRVPVEYILYCLFLKGLLPRSMTFAGWNMDVLSGFSALIISCYLLAARKKLSKPFLRTWNIAGMVLLAVVVITAVLSAPSPIQLLAFEQPNRAILLFPYTLLPAIVVPLVLLSHLLGLKKERISR